MQVNTKYELTAANTNKLWSKFEQELLGRPEIEKQPPLANEDLPMLGKSLQFFDQRTGFCSKPNHEEKDNDL